MTFYAVMFAMVIVGGVIVAGGALFASRPKPQKGHRLNRRDHAAKAALLLTKAEEALTDMSSMSGDRNTLATIALGHAVLATLPDDNDPEGETRG